MRRDDGFDKVPGSGKTGRHNPQHPARRAQTAAFRRTLSASARLSLYLAEWFGRVAVAPAQAGVRKRC